MIPSLPYLLMGFRVLKTDAHHTAPLLELCRRHTVPYEDFRNMPDGGISLRLTLPAARRLESLCTAADLPVRQVGSGGIPRLLSHLFRRPGLLLGGLLGLLLYFMAGRVFWDVRISGNQTVSDHSIRASLAACGLTVGAPIGGFRADETENRVLLLDDRLAWLSVNRKGTVAYVEVREATKEQSENPDTPCDMVASVGGVIEYIELESGNVRVRAGQTVSAGEVLVSGIYDTPQAGLRIEPAEARVFARTTREFQVTIPLSYQEKRYLSSAGEDGDEVICEKSVIFFNRHIKFSKKYRKITESCDIIEDEKPWGLLRGVGFPISTRTRWYLPYEIVPASRTYAEAEELAYFELAKYMSALPGGATLLGKTVTVRHSDEALTLTCTLTVIENIAERRIIEVEPYGSPNHP